MHTTVSKFLQDFPRMQRAALAGEPVIVHSPQGDLEVRALASAQTEPLPRGESLFGMLKDEILWSADDIDQPTTSDDEWKGSL
ncbi:MAG: hypothetical protein Q7P63_15020 [Verrucomicrobiota bacterium JB022]|nr:hypothetical protein [Verrucomicrobiota bacterium JB022]